MDSLNSKISSEGFWDNREEAEKVLKELKIMEKKLTPWYNIIDGLDDLKAMYELTADSGGEADLLELEQMYDSLFLEYTNQKLLEMFDEETDSCDAFLTIHSGAGGTEACDWVSMLYRMYMRWAEDKKFKVQILDMLEAEGGLKSVTVQISGEFVAGYLKGETGIHRLVRISPFDSNARRHTSFASVYVSPVIDDNIEVDIRVEDLRIDTYRAQGAGGQHVNTTDSAVRITHIPTNTIVQCQNERSQHKNKASAMKMLKSRLYEYYKEEQDKEIAGKMQEKKGISWGNQIRSYVFQPYTMVKDHRTKCEKGNIQAVMDGNIDDFIEEYLKWAWSQRQA
ncbi:MAG: peptide chain release factor 2 [Spirochaetales bacterium]|nr:peptide chain release factor 2 [Spirochaetales bacterium]